MNAVLMQEFQALYERQKQMLAQLCGKAVLITGATGLIGSWMVKFLLYLNDLHGMNIKIYAVSTSLKKLQDCFGADNPNLYFMQMDLSVPASFSKKFDFIIHAASPAHPDAFVINPVGVMRTNLIGTISLLNSMIGCAGGRFLFLSSGEVYGNNVGNIPFVETDAGSVNCTAVRACYPEAKRASETLCFAYNKQYGLHVNIARLCFVYGPTITAESTRADAQFLRFALDGENIILHTAGTQRRTWCYVADAVAGILQILLSAKSGEVYNVAHENSVATIFEYATMLANIAGVRVCVEENVSVGGNSILDGTKLIKLGWAPQYDLETGLQHSYFIKKSP